MRYPDRVVAAVLFLLLLLASCEDSTSLSRCGSPCFDGPGRKNVGICRQGVQECDESGNPTECVGAIYAYGRDWVCDGLDEDCDGETDEDYKVVECGTSEGECKTGWTRCREGVEICLGEVGPQPEQCSPVGVDHDCDGVPNNILPELCYDRDLIELVQPASACRPGVRVCENGSAVCAGQVLPQSEICGNGINEDCNEYVDDPLTGEAPVPLDIVLVIDRSCSMEEETRVIKSVVTQFLLDNSMRDDLRLWLVDLPGSASNDFRFNPICHPGLAGQGLNVSSCPRDSLLHAISLLAPIYGGIERSWDAFFDLASPGRVAWTPRSKKFLLFFGDEPGQTDPNRAISEEDAAWALAQAGIIFYGFVDYLNDYDDIADMTGGKLFLDYRELLSLLKSELSPQCQ